MHYSLLNLSKLISTLLFGLMAGFFATYSFNVNYAMLAVDGETYATVQSLFNINVRHLGFFVCFFGAGAAPFITAFLYYRHASHRITLAWIALGVGYTAGIIFFTKFVNLPLNYYTESWQPTNLPSDWQAVRETWNQANLFRTWLSIGLFSAALWLLSRSTKDTITPTE